MNNNYNTVRCDVEFYMFKFVTKEECYSDVEYAVREKTLMHALFTREVIIGIQREV